MTTPPKPQAPQFGWMDGQVRRWDSCTLHVRSQAAFWGANVFEGLRAYWQADQHRLALLHLQPHLKRLRQSMHCVDLEIDYSDEVLTTACFDLLHANEVMCDSHIVIAACFGMGANFDAMGHTRESSVHITVLPIGRSPRFETGVSATISSWRRLSDDTMPPRIKCGANYHNSRLAQQEAIRNGYDTAIFLNQRGTVAEAPGSCLIMVKDGTLVTPPGTAGVLEGITVNTIAQLAQRVLGLPTERREIDRTELYLADELFLAGTLVEIQPVTSVDRKKVNAGQPGSVTRALQGAFDAEVYGQGTETTWLTPVPAPQVNSDVA